MIDDGWKTQGACAGHEYPDWWTSRHEDERLQAVRICQGCPVQSECAAHAIASGQEHGIWGALLFYGTKHPHRIVDKSAKAEASCACCGIRFLLDNGNQLYCSDSCRVVAKQQRRRLVVAA